MPRDAGSGEYQPDAAQLAASPEGSDDAADRDAAEPRARDEPFFFADRQEYTEEPDTAALDDWVSEFKANPLLRRPIQLFVSDLLEPGYEPVAKPADPTADTDDWTEPEVPTDYPNSSYHGLALSDALARWLHRCGISSDSYSKDLTTVLHQALTDAYGRRGTGLLEHVYADASERQRLIGLRPFLVDDLTAYTREGKALLLRPDDTREDLQGDDGLGVAPSRAPTLSYPDSTPDDIPRTPAGKTAAFVQYDDLFASDELEQIPFALDDVTMFARDPDTGAVFGRPDTAAVVARAEAIRELYQDVDQGVKNAAWNSLVANVNTDSTEEAKKMLSGLDPNNPESVSVTNTNPDIQEIQGQTPDVVDLIQQQVEWVISALPVSLYRVGFEGDINRDVTGEQSDDYQDALTSGRQWVESQLRIALEQKACEFLLGHAHPEDVESADDLYGDPSEVPDVSLRVRPEDATSPLRSEHFDADAFTALMQGLKQAAPGGQVSQLVEPRAIVETVPGWDPDAVMPDAAQDAATMGALDPLDEADPAVQETFAEVLGVSDATLAEDGTGNGSEPFADVPVIPDNLTKLTRPWLIRWAEWMASGQSEIPEEARLANWNPALHPRDPETGKFIERPFDLPDNVDADAIQNGDSAALLEFTSDMGGRGLVEEILQDDSVTVDGVPDDIDNVRELKRHIRSTDSIERVPPSARGDSEGTAEMFKEPFEGEASVDLLAAEDSPAERRRNVDQQQRGPEIPPEMIANESIPVGEAILVNTDGRTIAREVQGYSFPSDSDTPVLDVGGGRTISPEEVQGMYRAAPRARAELSFDEWPDRFSERKAVVKDTLLDVVPKGQDSVVGRTVRKDGDRATPEISDETFEQIADRMAGTMADMDRETAEQTLARMSSVGDDIDRAHAGDRPGQNRPRAYIDTDEAPQAATINHELGHAIAHTAGLSSVDAGAAHDMDFWPTEDAELSEDADPINTPGMSFADNPIDQFTIGYRNDDIAEANDGDNAESLGRGDWEPAVDAEVSESAPDLGSRNFRNASDEYLLEASEGDMIRTEGAQEFGRHLAIREINDDPTGIAEREIVAEAKDGTEYEFEIEDRFGEVSVDSKTITEDRSRETTIFRTAGKRQTTPDNWGEQTISTPDPDDVLGGDEPETPQEKVEEWTKAANKAWFRMNLVANRQGKEEAGDYTIKSAYSSTNAHEVLSQTVEVMHPPVNNGRKRRRALRRLVRNQPEVLEAYRHIGDVQGSVRDILNDELEQAGAEFRFE